MYVINNAITQLISIWVNGGHANLRNAQNIILVYIRQPLAVSMIVTSTLSCSTIRHIFPRPVISCCRVARVSPCHSNLDLIVFHHKAYISSPCYIIYSRVMSCYPSILAIFGIWRELETFVKEFSRYTYCLTFFDIQHKQ